MTVLHKEEVSLLAGKPDAANAKRTLLKAAWVAPLVVAVTLPRSGFAANVSGQHTNNGKQSGKSKPD